MSINIAEALLKARKTLDLTQLEAQEMCGIDRRRLSLFETGKGAPTTDELARLKAAGLLEKRAAMPQEVKRNYISRWGDRLPAPSREPAHPLNARIAAAKARFGDSMERALGRLGAGEERLRALDFLTHSCSDSSTETFVSVSLLAAGASPLWIAPSRAGFRLLPILDRKTRHIISDLRHPCLEHTLGALQICVFPQLTVLASKGRHFRLDALVGVRLKHRRVWVNLEIDGSGHDNHGDDERQKLIGLPTVRINDADLRKGVESVLEDKLTALIRA